MGYWDEESKWRECPHYGPGWYCDARYGGSCLTWPHDYNPHANPAAAKSRFFMDRKPVGHFYGHIDSRHVRAEVYEYDGGRQGVVARQKFFYKKYPGEKAYAAAARWVEQAVGQDMFLLDQNRKGASHGR